MSEGDAMVDVGVNILLVIAIGRYKEWRRLEAPPCDAEAVKGVLLERYGFSEQHLLELADSAATRKGIVQAFKTLDAEYGSHDNLIIYHAGHGMVDSFTKKGLWIPYDAGRDEDEQLHWFSHDDLVSILSRLPFRHILLFSDSCFSGVLLDSKRDVERVSHEPDYTERAMGKRSREALTSGGAEPVPDVEYGNMSAFAYFLTVTLRDCPYEDGWLDGVRLYDHIRSGVRGREPQYGRLKRAGHQQGGAFILRPVKRGMSRRRKKSGGRRRPEKRDGANVPPPKGWYVMDVGRPPRGPFTEAEIREQIARGQVRPETLVWNAGLGQWIAAGRAAVFTREFARTARPVWWGRLTARDAAHVSGLLRRGRRLEAMQILHQKYAIPLSEVRAFVRGWREL